LHLFGLLFCLYLTISNILRYSPQLVQASLSLLLSLSTTIRRTVRYLLSCVSLPLVARSILLLAIVQSAPDRHDHILLSFTITRPHTTTVANHQAQRRHDTLLHSTVSTGFLLSPSRSPCHEHPITKDMSLTFITRRTTKLSLVDSASYARRARDINLTDSSKLS